MNDNNQPYKTDVIIVGAGPCGLFTVFDAVTGMETLDRYDEARNQIMLADRIILSKTDQSGDPSAIKDRLMSFNAAAQILTPAELLDEIAASDTGNWLQDIIPVTRQLESNEGHAHHHHHDINRHSERICCVTLRSQTPVKHAQLDLFLDLMLSAHGDHVLRIKGLVDVEGEERPLLIQAAGRRLSEPEFLPAWPDGVATTSLVIFLDGMKPEFVTGLFASTFVVAFATVIVAGLCISTAASTSYLICGTLTCLNTTTSLADLVLTTNIVAFPTMCSVLLGVDTTPTTRCLARVTGGSSFTLAVFAKLLVFAGIVTLAAVSFAGRCIHTD